MGVEERFEVVCDGNCATVSPLFGDRKDAEDWARREGWSEGDSGEWTCNSCVLCSPAAGGTGAGSSSR